MNLLLENLGQQKQVFIRSLLMIRDRPNKTSVHDLRVSVKKIRAYLRLSEKITGIKWKESFATVAVMYKSAGTTSDFDVSSICVIKKFRTEPHLVNFKDYLIANRSVTRKWVKESATAFNEQDIDELDQYCKIDLTDAEITQKIIEFSKVKIKAAKRLMNHFQKHVHKVRKLLKDVINWAKIGQKDLIDDFINIKALDNMLTHLGNWQDQFVLIDKTKDYKKEIVIDKTEKLALDKLLKDLAASQEKELELAIKKWKSVEK